MDNNYVPDVVPEEEDEQNICNIQNKKDITGEDAQAKDLIQECEGAQDVRVVHNDDIKKEDDVKNLKEKEFGQEDGNKESKVTKMFKKEEDTPQMEAAQEEEDTQESERFLKEEDGNQHAMPNDIHKRRKISKWKLHRG